MCFLHSLKVTYEHFNFKVHAIDVVNIGKDKGVLTS
jgi:hypothetical protein